MHKLPLGRLFDEVDLRIKSTIPRGSILKMYRFPHTIQGSGEQYTQNTS